MWGNNKIWTHFRNDILATDEESADFLASYLRFVLMNRTYLRAVEIHDLQSYKVIRDTKKLRSALREKLDTPFIFIGYYN